MKTSPTGKRVQNNVFLMERTRTYLFFMLCLFPAILTAQSVVDVITYAGQNDLSDPYHGSGILQRCSGVLMGYAKYLPSDMQKQKQVFAEKAQKTMVRAGVILHEAKQISDEASLEQITSAFIFYTEHYFAKIERTQLATGSIFSGEVADELMFCSEIVRRHK